LSGKSLGRRKQRHTAEEVWVPQRQKAGLNQIRHGDANGNIENQAVIRGDDEIPARRRKEINERQERDQDRGHETLRFSRMTIETHQSGNGKPELSGTKTPAWVFHAVRQPLAVRQAEATRGQTRPGK